MNYADLIAGLVKDFMDSREDEDGDNQLEVYLDGVATDVRNGVAEALEQGKS